MGHLVWGNFLPQRLFYLNRREIENRWNWRTWKTVRGGWVIFWVFDGTEWALKLWWCADCTLFICSACCRVSSLRCLYLYSPRTEPKIFSTSLLTMESMSMSSTLTEHNNRCHAWSICHDLYIMFLGRLLRVDLIKPVSNARPYVHPCVHKKFFDFNETWYVGRGRRVMHDGMQYDPIQS